MQVTVLFVDDSEVIRDAVKDIFEGYIPWAKLLMAEDGVIAWGVIKTPGLNIKLLVSDTNMPNRNGPDLIEQVRKEYPEIMTVLISANDPPPSHPAHFFVGKPFDIDEFVSLVKRLAGKT